MTARQERALVLASLLAGVVLVVFLAAKTFQNNLLYFFSPTDIMAGKTATNVNFKLGGLVKTNSLQQQDLTAKFIVTDNNYDFQVEYTGILPDLFREGQGIIATGKLVNNIFIATEVLAKHDENYMPPEVAAALNKKHSKLNE